MPRSLMLWFYFIPCVKRGIEEKVVLPDGRPARAAVTS
jgi:hypothetical protein